MKKITMIVLILALATLAFGCKDNGDGDKVPDAARESYSDYNLSEYVTLGQYLGIEVEPQVIEVTEADVQAEIQNVLRQNAAHEELTEGVVAEGDTLNIDYSGSLDGVAFDGGTATGAPITIGEGRFIPGFEDGLIGVNVGDTVDLNLTFPVPYPNNPDLAGKETVFTITVNSISKETVPEYTDAFVQSISDSHSNTEEYTAYINQYLLETAELNAISAKQNAVWSRVLENATILNMPQAQLDAQMAEAGAYYEQMATYYNTTLDAFVTDYLQMTTEEYNDFLLDQAESAVTTSLVFYAIAEAEGMEITSEEYDKGVESYLIQFGFTDADQFEETYGAPFEEYFGESAINESLLWEKVITLVTDASVEI